MNFDVNISISAAILGLLSLGGSNIMSTLQNKLWPGLELRISISVACFVLQYENCMQV